LQKFLKRKKIWILDFDPIIVIMTLRFAFVTILVVVAVFGKALAQGDASSVWKYSSARRV
jgi:hypothetical protein